MKSTVFYFIFFFTPQVLNWGGGLGGTGFACRICHFVAKNLESLVTHTGYKHSLFYEFMSEDMQKEYRDIADKVGEKLWWVFISRDFLKYLIFNELIC